MSNGRRKVKLDSKSTDEIFNHLEKQSELLMEFYRVMANELHRLQVEEEMLMRKFYEITTAQGLTKQYDNVENTRNGDDVVDGDGLSGRIVRHPSDER